MSGKSKAVSDEYTSALSDLNFNSKPMINVLTMLAEENSDYAQVIVQCICDRIKKVGVDQKMPSLYLLDSILKNIGGEYVAIIAKHIVNTFCSVFESANDERKRMQLFKLRNTWAQYVPNSTLYELDIRISRTDPNWPIASPHNGSSNALPVKANASHQKMIHVNPKFLQKNDTAKLVAGNQLDTSISGEKSNLDASKLQSKISKQRLLDEEKRVQEQLKLLQTEKLKRDRERHELELKQQHLERERLLAEQKRQLEVLRKQQQTLSSPNENKNTLPKGQTRQVGVKDPRLKGASTSSNTVPTREKVTSPSDASKQFKFNTKGNDGAVSVMNKIMTTLKTKPTAQQLAKERMTKGNKRSPMTSPTNVNAPSTKASKSVSPPAKSVSPPTTANKTATTNSTSSTTSKVTASNSNLDLPKKTREVVSDPTNHSVTVAPPTSVPPLPYSAAFTQLSTRDMQIAAQAAAIATAMHQMQSGINAPMVPEQSAMIAAQLVKVMQGSTQPALNPVTTAASSSEVNAVVTTTSVTSSPLPVSVNQQAPFARTDGKEKKLTEEGRLNERTKDRYQERESRKNEFARDAPDNRRKIPGNDRKYKASRNTSPLSDQAEVRKQRERIKERNKSPERRKDESSNNKRANESHEHTERPRKARARSPSRYYCRVEQKMEVNKRVEEKEKQLVLQRIRKNSGGEVSGKMRKKSDSSTHDETLPDDLESIELPEIETVVTPNVRCSTQPAPAVKTENLVGTKPDKMTNMEWEALKKIRKKEYIVLNTKLLDVKRKKEQPLDPNVFLKLKDEAGFKFKEGKLSKEQTDDIFNQIDVIRNEIKLHQSNEHLHWRSRQDLNHLSPLKHPAGRNNVRPRFNDPRHPAVFNDGLPQHHMRNGPRHFRGGPPQRPHMGERLPLHVGEGLSHIRDRLPPPHMTNGPRPNIRENAVPPFIREGPQPPHIREGPVPHMREGPLPSHLRDGHPPDHTREGPIPPHVRNGPQPVHLREDDGPRPPFIRDRAHFRDANMAHEFNGPPRFNGPPQHFREGPLPPHVANENMEPRMPEQHFFRSNSPQPPMHYVEPPYQESFGPRHGEAGKPVDVSNLLGQLFRAGILDNVKTEPEVDLNVPTIPFNLDDLRRRHQAVINHLFQGLQCSSCGQRFPDDARQQYSEHLDWHFRQNRKEKDGDRKVSSRTWFYDLSDWIEHAEKTVGEDGKVQSELFEAEKTVKSEESDAPIKTSRKKTEDRSVPVLPDDGEAVCSVCMEPLEQFWDEDQEEWRYSKGVRENKKVYHYHCFTDYVPFEFEESTTPSRTPRSSVTDDTKQEFDSSFSPPPEIKEEPEETQQITPVNTKLNVRKDDGISDVAAEHNMESQKCLKESTSVTSTLTKLSLPKATEVIHADSIKKEPSSPDNEQQQQQELVVNKVTKAETVKEKPVEKVDQQKNANETENLDELDAPNSPEFPFVSSTTPQSIPVSPTEEVITKNEDGSVAKLDAVTENVIIGVKRSIDSDFESNARKEMKMDVKAETSINDCAISVIKEEPCVTEVQPKLNKSDNEAI